LQEAELPGDGQLTNKHLDSLK